MITLRIGQSVEFKAKKGLGGWQPGTVSGFVGKLIEVRAGWLDAKPETGVARFTHAVPPSQVRPSREETRPDRGAQQAAARAQRLVMAPPPMETEEVEEVIPRDVKPYVIVGDYVVPRPSAMGSTHPIRPQPKAPKPTRSQAYRKHVIMQGCAVTGAMAEDAHHYGPHALSEKGSDFTCVGLTHAEHSEWHTTGMSRHAEEWARAKGYGYGTLATKVMHLEGALRSLVSWLEKEGE